MQNLHLNKIDNFVDNLPHDRKLLIFKKAGKFNRVFINGNARAAISYLLLCSRHAIVNEVCENTVK